MHITCMQSSPHKHAHKILRYMNRVRCKQTHVQHCVISEWRVTIDLRYIKQIHLQGVTSRLKVIIALHYQVRESI